MARDIVNPSRPPKLTRSTRQVVREAELLSEGLSEYEEARAEERYRGDVIEDPPESWEP